MSILSGNKNFFGLDIGTGSIRIVQLSGDDRTRQKTLVRYAYAPVDSKIIFSEAKSDKDKLSQYIKSLVTQSNIDTKNVAVGISSSRVFTAVVDIDKLKDSELAKSITYQADAFIPTPINDSIIDWAVVGESPRDKTKYELLLSSTTKDYTTAQLDMIEMAGLNVIAFEPDIMAITRSLVNHATNDVSLIIDIGSRSTDVVVVVNDSPRLSRSIPIGNEAFVRAVAQNLNSEVAQAEQFLYKFGMSQDKLEGQIYQSVIMTIENLMNEIDKSIKFFNDRYVGVKISKVIVAGSVAIIPDFPLFVANRLAIPVEIADAWHNVLYDTTLRSELMSISNQFSVAVGLAERYI